MVFLNQKQVRIFCGHLYQPVGEATLGKQSICDFIAFEYGCQFFGLAFFLQSGVNSHVHRLCMVFALTKEEPLVLVIYRRNIIVPPVRADA